MKPPRHNIRRCSLPKWHHTVPLHYTSVLNNTSLCAFVNILQVNKKKTKLVQPTDGKLKFNFPSHPIFFFFSFFFLHIYNLYFAHATQYFECSFKVRDLIYIFFTYCVRVCVCTCVCVRVCARTLPDVHIFLHSYILRYDTLLDSLET